METRAPAVVAVVVTTGPAPLLGTTLLSLAAQDYGQVSVLVLANGDPTGVEALVAGAVPSGFVRVLEDNTGFAATCNEVLGMVEGAAFLCFCHDDVELAPDAIHQMVEEAYRSNAGIVTPKFVRPEDHHVLLHVGLNADRFGATTERVEPGEVDQGQQDSARDVFVAPGGVTLVRADLFETLGGFDPSIVAMGEDLDLCWRAQVLGSRVVVAHAAVVVHHELLANGTRQLAASVKGHGGRTLQALTRRHRLATMLTCYGWLYLIATTAVLVLLELAEVLVAAFGRDRDRIGAVVGSWRWCVSRLGTLRRRHRALARARGLDDRDVRRLQVAGASRLQTFGSRLVHEGVDAARGALVPAAVAAAQDDDEHLDHTVGFGAAFSDDASFDELDDLGRRESRLHVGFLATFPTQVVVVGVAALVFAIGVRNLIASHLPLVGRLAPLDSWRSTWDHFFATWSSTGVGTGAPGMPGFGVLGLAGTLAFGRMGVLPRAVLVFAIPLGALGMWRLLREVGSNRARIVGAVAFVAVALGPNLVAGGRVDALAVFAVLPFLTRRLLVVARVPPFFQGDPAARPGHLEVSSRSRRLRQLVGLGALEAVLVAVDPAAGVAFVAAALGLSAGGWLVGDRRAAHVLGLALGASIVAAALLLPLTLDTLGAGSAGLSVFGAPSGPWSLPGLGGLVRGVVGPFGASPLSWLLPGAALLALVVGRGERFATAARLAGMGIASLAVALLVARHLTGPFAPDVATLLVPYAVAVAGLVGVGVAAFEQDVAAAQFGWRQLVAAVTMLVIAVGTIPFVASVSTGRFDLPQQGYDVQLGSLHPPTTGGSRTLWLGDPRSVPLASWSIEPGLAYATAANGLPGGQTAFAPPSSGAAGVLSDDVVTALRGQTVHLGRLLATAGIAYVVVVTATAPSLQGNQHPIDTPPPADLLPALRRQLDLAAVPLAGGAAVFANTAWRGIVAERPQPLDPAAAPGSAAATKDWTPALGSTSWTGAVAKGTLLAGLAPAGDFTAVLGATTLPRSDAFGWASSWRVPAAGTAQLTLDAWPLNGALATLVLVLWLAAAALVVGPERLARARRALRPRRAPTPDADPVDPGAAPVAAIAPVAAEVAE
ncbi:MAG TPA: glycosyltransferase [Acidimicrobiales bacterium]|jgi:GT2 family glycosyltransferase|nr:glycosyltransferase [Acidimicrobiales bacterium]